MPKFRVSGPDGSVWDVEAPEGATEADAIAYAQQQAGSRVTNLQANWQKNNPVGSAQTVLIGAGRQGDKLVEGAKQLGLSANVAGRELMGMDSGEQLRKLADLEQTQQFRDAGYQPLKEQHPFLTGAGEAAYLAAIPAGQATMAARVGIPGAVAAANELLSFGSPQERTTNAANKGVTALGGGGLGEGVRALIAPAKSSLNAAQQRALDSAAQNIGYTPRASELTGNETLRRLEDAVARQPGGAGPMRDLMKKNAAAIGRTASKSIGEQTDQVTDDVLANASERIGQTYNGLRQQAQMPVTSDITDAVTRAKAMLTRGDTTGPKKTALDAINRLEEQLYASKTFDGDTYQSWTSDLGALARQVGKENRTAAAALREVEKAMDKVAQGPNAALWKQTDRQNAALETLMKPGVVNTQTGEVSVRKLASQMERQFGKQLKTGKVDGPLVDLASLARAMPPMAEGSQTAGREAFGSLPGWMLAAPNYALSKALTSEFGRDYLSHGLLGNPAVSKAGGDLLSKGAVPLSIAEIQALLLGYQ